MERPPLNNPYSTSSLNYTPLSRNSASDTDGDWNFSGNIYHCPHCPSHCPHPHTQEPGVLQFSRDLAWSLGPRPRVVTEETQPEVPSDTSAGLTLSAARGAAGYFPFVDEKAERERLSDLHTVGKWQS